MENNGLTIFYQFIYDQNCLSQINCLMLKISVAKKLYVEYENNWKLKKGAEVLSDHEYVALMSKLLEKVENNSLSEIGLKWKVINSVHSIIEKFIEDKASSEISLLEKKLGELEQEVGHA